MYRMKKFRQVYEKYNRNWNYNGDINRGIIPSMFINVRQFKNPFNKTLSKLQSVKCT